MPEHDNLLDTPIEDGKNVPIYSSIAVGAFTFFFSTLFGGVMAYQNLRRVGKPDIANKVLLASIIYIVGVVTLEVLVGIPNFLTLPLNIGAAWMLGNHVHTTFIPDHKDMPKRKIWVPLAIGLAILGLILAAVFVGDGVGLNPE